MTYRSISTAASTYGTPVSSIVITAPAGIQANDVLIAYFGCASDPGIITWPLGFTQLTGFVVSQSGTNSLYVAWKVATTSEPSSYTISCSTPAYPVAGVISFYNVSGTISPVQTTTQQAATLIGNSFTFGTGCAAISSNAIRTDVCLIETKMYGQNVAATFTAPTNFTQADPGTSVLSQPYTTIGVAYGQLSNGGSISGGTISISGMNNGGYGIVAVQLYQPGARLTNTGTFLTNGMFDEITKTISSMDNATIYAPNTGGFDEVNSPIVVDNSLILNLSANANQYYPDANRTWYDITNNNYNFSIYNTTTFTSGNISSYNFNTSGTFDYAKTTYNLANNLPNMTVLAWIKTSNLATSVVVGKIYNLDNIDYPVPGGGNGWALILDYDGIDTRPGFVFASTGTAIGIEYVDGGSPNPPPRVADGNWHHIGVSLTGYGTSTFELYVDGYPYAVTGQGIGNLEFNKAFNTTTTLTLAQDLASTVSGHSWAFQGSIGGVQIYNRALNDREVLTNYLGGASQFGLTTSTGMRIGTATTYISGILDEVTGAA